MSNKQQTENTVGSAPRRWHLFVPKTYTVLRQGYGLTDLRADMVAGLTVAIVALPLAMALAIASGAGPDKGLITAVVAGFLISALGGSRFQIGGPTGAFVVVVFNVIAQHGYDGLLLATLMAGAMLVVAGLIGLGTYIKYVPQPAVTGFTAGIAVIIFSSQIKDFLGLAMPQVPVEFFEKWLAVFEHLDTLDIATTLLAAASLAGIAVFRRLAPKAPGFLIVVAAGAVACWALGLPVDTIGSRFGEIPRSLPAPALPDISLARVRELLPSAFTIAFLAGVESLLSALVADGMTGRRHRSNCELMAQGVANTASALFGGLPATGAIARTATNIRSGARSPVAGMLHAVFLLLFMLLLAPLAAHVPLASLAAVLMVVAWNMSEVDSFRRLLRATPGERAVLLVTFGLTVAVDLTVAIEVGVVLAAFLFMHRMSQVVQIQTHTDLIQADVDDITAPNTAPYTLRADLPEGVESFQITGPFFFGVANRLGEVLDQIARSPKVFILRMCQVPLLDATGAQALAEFAGRCRRHGTFLILTGVRPGLRPALDAAGVVPDGRSLAFAGDFPDAIDLAREHAAQTDQPGLRTAGSSPALTQKS